MRYTWFMFLGLTLVGAVIAFMGDRLGRYMGKRRLTIFGLRPRHTALLFTVLAGMLISVTSLVTMSLISSRVRTAVFDVEFLLQQHRNLSRTNRDLQGRNRSLVLRTNELQTDHDRWERNTREAEARAKQSREQLRLTLTQLERARSGAANLQRELLARRRAIAQKSAEIPGLRKRQQAVEANLTTAQAQLKSAKERYQQADTLRAEAEGRYQKTNTNYFRLLATHNEVSRDLSTAQRDLDAKRRELEAAKAELGEKQHELSAANAQFTRAQAQVAGLQATKRELETTQVRLRDEQERLLAQVNSLDARSKQLQQDLNASQGSEVIFPMGSELASQVIDGRESPARIREQVADLVARARATAEKAHAGGPGRPALIVKRRFQGEGSVQTVEYQDERAIDAVTEEIGRERAGVLAQVMAETNAVAGTSVAGHIQLWRNRLVFHQGDAIAQKALAGRQQTGQIVEALVALLQGEVRTAAATRGMVPRWSPSASITTPEFGEMPLADLVAAAEQVRKCRNGAVVQIVAPTDLWSADPMRVAFRVSPARTLDAGNSRPGPVGAIK